MLNLVFDSRPSARWLEETKSLKNATVEAERLVRKTVAWTTGIMLIIATLLGVSLYRRKPHSFYASENGSNNCLHLLHWQYLIFRGD